MLTLKDVLTSSGRYPEREKHKEVTEEVKANIEGLLAKVNPLLAELGWKNPSITSGFRPSEVNAGIGNASKKSNHMLGKAMDILDDKKQTLALSVTKELLEKYDLYREDSDATIGKNTNWCHLQTTKTKSGKRIFKP